MKDEMANLLEIVEKLNEERCREYVAAIMAGDETKSKQLDYAVEAFGMVEWAIKDPKYADYLRRIYELDTLDEREQESPKDVEAAKSSIETETKPTTADEFERLVDSASTVDAVPVVRCKDCKHAETLFVGKLTGEKVLLCNAWHAYINPSMYDYCSKGERREGNDL